MEKANGVVRSLKYKKAIVFIKRNSMCGDSCATCGLCGEKETVIEAENSINAKAGQEVIVAISTSKGLLAAGLVYGVPLIIIISVALLMSLIGELKGVLLIFAGIALWFLIIWVLEKKGVLSHKFGAKIVKIEEKNK